MAWAADQSKDQAILARAAAQHGVVSRAQLLGLGLSARAIEHRLARGRLHVVYRGVYAVGRPELTREGRWMGAVLRCGPGAGLSHASAARISGIWRYAEEAIEVSVPPESRVRQRGIRAHRRRLPDGCGYVRREGIPLTPVNLTLADLAAREPWWRVEAAVNEADRLELATPDELRQWVAAQGPIPGFAALRRVLDRRTFVLTDSELERRFLPLVRAAGLGRARTREHLNGFRVDFHWPDLGLVVETDGLRYHRTPAQQARDRLRDQAHTAAGLTPLRFTHAQVVYERDHVIRTLRRVAAVKRRLVT